MVSIILSIILIFLVLCYIQALLPMLYNSIKKLIGGDSIYNVLNYLSYLCRIKLHIVNANTILYLILILMLLLDFSVTYILIFYIIVDNFKLCINDIYNKPKKPRRLNEGN